MRTHLNSQTPTEGKELSKHKGIILLRDCLAAPYSTRTQHPCSVISDLLKTQMRLEISYGQCAQQPLRSTFFSVWWPGLQSWVISGTGTAVLWGTGSLEIKEVSKMPQGHTSGPALAFYKPRIFRFWLSQSTERHTPGAQYSLSKRKCLQVGA